MIGNHSVPEKIQPEQTYQDIAQLVERSPWKREVVGSSPAILTYLNGSVAQLVERWREVPEVVGSNPAGSTYNQYVKGVLTVACKASVDGFESCIGFNYTKLV